MTKLRARQLRSSFGFRHSFVIRHSDFVIPVIFDDYEHEQDHEVRVRL